MAAGEAVHEVLELGDVALEARARRRAPGQVLGEEGRVGRLGAVDGGRPPHDERRAGRGSASSAARSWSVPTTLWSCSARAGRPGSGNCRRSSWTTTSAPRGGDDGAEGGRAQVGRDDLHARARAAGVVRHGPVVEPHDVGDVAVGGQAPRQRGAPRAGHARHEDPRAGHDPALRRSRRSAGETGAPGAGPPARRLDRALRRDADGARPAADGEDARSWGPPVAQRRRRLERPRRDVYADADGACLRPDPRVHRHAGHRVRADADAQGRARVRDDRRRTVDRTRTRSARSRRASRRTSSS